ncbi:MAG: CPBP family intramembrane metalloprotease [Paludibacter sp.]|nr:CPBP family intramembrane metalloprotease [Paludibacter sp.]
MHKRPLKNSGITKILHITFVELLMFFIVILIISLIAGNDTSNIQLMKISQLVESIGLFVIPPLLLAYLWNEKPAEYLYLKATSKATDYLLVIILMIVAIPFINLLGNINQQIALPEFMSGIEQWMKSTEEQLADLTEKIVNVHSLGGLSFNLLVIALVPAIGEELFFRGTIQKLFTERGKIHTGIWIAAIIFSTFHMQFYGFIPRMLLGALFGYLLVWGKNLWLPITAHFTNNAFAVIFYYLKYNGVKVPDIDTIGTGSTLWLGIVSGVIATILFIFLSWKLKINKQEQ